MSRAQIIAEAIKADLLADKRKAKRQRTESPGSDFDPYSVTCWRVIAGGDPGYLPETTMSKSGDGWQVKCRCCFREFESTGLAYCPLCEELPAEERRANRKALKRNGSRTATRHRATDANASMRLLSAGYTEIIEEFPPIFGFSDWPTNLVGTGRRGRALPPDFVATTIRVECSDSLWDGA